MFHLARHDLLSFSSLYSGVFEHDECMVYKIHELTIKCCVFNVKQSRSSHRKEKISETCYMYLTTFRSALLVVGTFNSDCFV